MAIAYQGSKRRFAEPIVDELERRWGAAATWPRFWDLCCGSCAITAEVRRRAPGVPVVAVDAGHWGAFWAAFQADRDAVFAELEGLYKTGPTRRVCNRLDGRRASDRPARWAAEFLVAMRGGYMGRLPTIADDGRWSLTCATKPTGRDATFLLKRFAAVPVFEGRHGYAEEAVNEIARGDVVYIDPGYAGLTGGHYNDTCDVPRVVRTALSRGGRVALSHHQAYPGVEGDQVTVTVARCQRDVCRREVLIFP